MRVAMVSPYALGSFGGVQRQAIGLARALSEDEVRLFSPAPTGDPDGCDAVSLGRSLAIPANGSRAPLALAPGAWRRTRRALVAFQPDVIHVHEPFAPVVGLAASSAPGAPVIATFHRSGASSGYRAFGPLLRPIVRRLACAVAVSEAAASTLRAVLGGSEDVLEILPNAIDRSRFADARRVPTRRPTIVFVGRLEARKGVSVLLEAIARSPRHFDAWIIGDGPEGPSLRRRFGGIEGVTFLGPLGDDEAAARLASADVAVAPSLGGESFGVVLLEAMAAGTAVVAADLPGYRLAAGDAACYVPPGDARCLAAALRSLLTDRSRREHLVAAGHRRVAPRGFPALAQRYLARYEAARRR